MKKTKYIFLFLFFIGSINSLLAQNIDSLKHALKNAKHDTIKLIILDQLTEISPEGEWQQYNEEINVIVEKNLKLKPDAKLENRLLKFKATFFNNKATASQQIGEIEEAMRLFEESIKLRKRLGDKDGLAVAYNNIGIALHSIGNLEKAMEFQKKSYDLYIETKNKDGIAKSMVNMGWILENQGNVTKALDNYLMALKMQEQLKNRKSLAISYNNIGMLYFKQGITTRAKEYLHKSLEIEKEFNNTLGVAYTLYNIGNINRQEKDTVKALENFHEALKLFNQTGEKGGISSVLVSLGDVYRKRENYDSAMYYLTESLRLREEIGDAHGMANSLRNIGGIYFEKNDLKKAEEYGLRSLAMAKKINYPLNICDAAALLYRTYKKLGKNAQALEMHELYIELRDSVMNESTRKQSMQKQFEYEYGQKALTDSLKTAEEKKLVAVQFKEEQTKRYALYGGLVLILVFSGFLFKRFKVEQGQKKMIAEQKHLVDEKQKEVMDSIKYAKRIQQSLMPTDKYIERNVNKLKNKK